MGDTCGGKAVLITGGGTGIERPPRPRSLACGSTVAVSGRTAQTLPKPPRCSASSAPIGQPLWPT
jgi:short-subunit dehydrogenase involved in D-alanine esterification of teichoic acids